MIALIRGVLHDCQRFLICPKCGGKLKYYDRVSRIVRTEHGRKIKITLRRFKCEKYNTIHREIPKIIFPHKQYSSEIIKGVLNDVISPDILEYEDFPCEETMKRWKIEYAKSQKIQCIL